MSNIDHYANKPEELDKLNKRQTKQVSKTETNPLFGGCEFPTRKKIDEEMVEPKAEDFFKKEVAVVVEEKPKDKRLIKFVTNQYYIEQKFKTIETL